MVLFRSFTKYQRKEAIGTIEAIETIGTIETIEAIETIGTIDTIGTIETIETIGTIETIDTIETIETIKSYENHKKRKGATHAAPNSSSKTPETNIIRRAEASRLANCFSGTLAGHKG